MSGVRVFFKSHWGKGFARYPWFWWNLCRWPNVGFALLVCGFEIALIAQPQSGGSPHDQ